MTQPRAEPTTNVMQGELFAGETGAGGTSAPRRREVPVEQGERGAVQSVVSEARKMAEPFQAFAAIKPGSADSLEKLESALARLPAGDTFSRAVEALRTRASETLTRARRERGDAFRRIETEFVQSSRTQGEPVREQSNGWRVASLELQVRREQGQIRWLYNREVLIDWSPVTSAAVFADARGKAQLLLKKEELPETVLKDAFWDTYQECLRLQQSQGRSSNLVPLGDFYRELRLTLVRRELTQKPDKRISQAEFPKWAFLYNLDRYRTLAASLPADRRLALQTGSQRDTARLGMVTNGLDGRQDYQVVCYVLQG